MTCLTPHARRHLETGIGSIKAADEIEDLLCQDGDAEYSFTTIQTDNGTSPAATGTDDVLTFTSSSLVITGNATTDTIQIENKSTVNVVVTTVTSTTYTAGNEHIILVNDDTAGAAVTISLPTAVGISGRVYKIKRIGSTYSVTVDPFSTQTIDGDPSFTLLQDEIITIVSNGANWFIV